MPRKGVSQKAVVKNATTRVQFRTESPLPHHKLTAGHELLPTTGFQLTSPFVNPVLVIGVLPCTVSTIEFPLITQNCTAPVWPLLSGTEKWFNPAEPERTVCAVLPPTETEMLAADFKSTVKKIVSGERVPGATYG